MISQGPSKHLSHFLSTRPRTLSARFRAARSVCCASLSPQPLTLAKHTWKWDGHDINYVVAGCGEPVVLVHGFGASGAHFRRSIPVLSQKYKVYAIDLLGFGQSEKADRAYSIELWRDLVLAFTDEFVDKPFVLVGNSVGSLVCLSVTASSDVERVKGIALLNCAGGMNNKARIDDWRVKLAYPLFLLLDFLLNTSAIAEPLFKAFSKPERIRGVLQNIYVNQAAVDDELVHDIICKPSLDTGALKVFVSVLTGPPGPKPEDLLANIQQPVLILWGDKDIFTPIDGPVGVFCQKLPLQKDNARFELLPGSGHCPHDDTPDLVHASLLPWLDEL